MNKPNNKTVLIIIAFISLILGSFITSISLQQGCSRSEPFAWGISSIADDPSVQKALEVQNAFRLVVKLLKPAVVNISTETVIRNRFGSRNDPFEYFFGDDLFEYFFGSPRERESIQRALGSGVIVDKDGYILSNHHVIANADKIMVKLANGKEYKAEIIGTDEQTDLALLKIKAKEKLQAAPIGDSDMLEIGDWAIAIGNPFGLDHTFTIGIISAKGRSGIMDDSSKYENYIQTDAAINQGNSGGPLVNIKGEIIGINTAIYSPSGGSIGIGFAIPINMVKTVFKQLKEKGKVTRGYLGITIQNLTPDLAKHFNRDPNSGVLIADVMKKSAADKGGLKSGDIIIEFNGKKMKNASQLRFAVAETMPGTTVKIKIIRNGKKKTLSVTIGELPPEGEKAISSSNSKSDLWFGLKVDEISSGYIDKFNLDSDESGIIITYVKPGSKADKGGLRRGDIIKKINSIPISDYKDFKAFIKKYGNKDSFLLIIKRQGRLFYLTIYR